MSGFPNRPVRTLYGPTMVNTRPVRDRSREVDAATVNLERWQLAGAGLMVPRAVILLDGATASIVYRAEAWNPDAVVDATHPDPTVTKLTTGTYAVEYEATYPDHDGTAVNTVFNFMRCQPQEVSTKTAHQCRLTSNRKGTAICYDNTWTVFDPFRMLIEFY